MAAEPRPLSPVIVHWADSMAQPGWGEYNRDVDLVCATVGHLVESTESRIVVALSKNEHQYSDYLTIPRCAVKTIHYLDPGADKAAEPREPNP